PVGGVLSHAFYHGVAFFYRTVYRASVFPARPPRANPEEMRMSDAMETSRYIERPLHEYLREHARERPDKPAYLWYGQAITYAELDRASDAFAARLAETGVRKGEPV